MIRLTVLYNLPEGTDEAEFLRWRLGEHQAENAAMPGVSSDINVPLGMRK